MKVDPVSGNEIPPGVGAENVRDDIPANLSDGEYVFAADVVKFYGLDKLESMARKAKEGMSQLVTEERIKTVEPTLEEEVEGFASGGMVDSVKLGNLVNKVKQAISADPSLNQTLNGMGVSFAKGGSVGKKDNKTFNPSNWDVPGISYFNGNQSSQFTTYRIYVDANGNRISIPFIGNEPQIAIPQGYKPEGSEGSQENKEEGPDPEEQQYKSVDYTSMSDEQLQGIIDGKDSGFLGGVFGNLGEFLGNNTAVGKLVGMAQGTHIKKAEEELATRTNKTVGASYNGGSPYSGSTITTEVLPSYNTGPTPEEARQRAEEFMGTPSVPTSRGFMGPEYQPDYGQEPSYSPEVPERSFGPTRTAPTESWEGLGEADDDWGTFFNRGGYIKKRTK